MKRGQVYFNHYRDAMGRDKRVPVLILSRDDYNRQGEFVTALRLTRYNNVPCAQHVYIPGSAFSETTQYMGDCYALAETVGSVKKAAMEGPIAELSLQDCMDAVCGAVEYQIGTRAAEKAAPMERPTLSAPWYSAAVSPQMRPTNPSRDQEG